MIIHTTVGQKCVLLSVLCLFLFTLEKLNSQVCPNDIINIGTTANGAICADSEITLCLDGTDFPLNGEICWYQVPSPGAIPIPGTDPLLACISIPSGISTGGPVLNEILFDPIDAMDGTAGGTCEFIEIAGTPGFDMSCYIITDGDFMIVLPVGTVIPADGILVIADASVMCDDFDPSIVDVDLMSCVCCTSCDLVLNNTGEFINLMDPSGIYVDGIVWGSPTPGNLPGMVESINSTIQCGATPSTITTNPATPITNAAVMNGESIVRDPDITGDWVGSKSINGNPNTGGFPNSVPGAFCTNITLDNTFCGEIYINSIITGVDPSCPSGSNVGIGSHFTMTCPDPEIKTHGAFCDGQLFLLEVDGPNAFSSYAWSSNGSATITGSNTSTIIVSGNVVDGDIFTLTEVGINGCIASTTTTVSINPKPEVTVQLISGMCEGDEVELNAIGPNEPGTSWFWTATGTGTFIDNTVQSPSIVGASNGDNYTVLVTDVDGCSQADNLVVTLNPQPSVSLTTVLGCEVPIGIGFATFNLSSVESIVTGNAPGVVVSWYEDGALQNAIPDPSAFVSPEANVYARVTNLATGCMNSTIVSLAFQAICCMPPSISTLIVGESCNGSDASITINTTGGEGTFTYSLDNGTTVQSSNVFMGLTSGIYTITVIVDGDLSCTETSSVIIEDIIDDIDPTINCPQDIVIDNVNGECNALVDLPVVTGSDNCPGVVVNCSLSGTNVFPVGSTEILCSATDSSGNMATCSYNVIVNDAESPAIQCPPNIVVTMDLNCDPIFEIPDYTGLATASDNCTGQIVTQAPVSGTILSPNSGDIILITLTATDVSGSVDVCSFNISIIDNVGVTISCPGDQTNFLDPNCNSSLIDHSLLATYTNVCGPISALNITQEPVAGTIINGPGITATTLTVDDGNGNSSTCTFLVNTVDLLSPVFTGFPPDISIPIGTSTDPFITGQPIASDNCDNPLITYSDVVSLGNCPILEIITRTWTLTDLSGNQTSGQQVITIVVPSLSLNLISMVEPTCPGSNDGSISVEVIGGTPPFNISWSDLIGTPGQTLDRTGIGVGNYSVTVTDLYGCTQTLSVTLNAPSPIPSNAGPDQTVCGIMMITLGADPAAGGVIATWSHNGDGTISDVNDPNAMYTPGAEDLGTTVTFTWTVPSPVGICFGVSTMELTVLDNGCGGFPWDGGIPTID